MMIKLRRVISEALALKTDQILHRMYTIPYKGEKWETEKKKIKLTLVVNLTKDRSKYQERFSQGSL